MCTYNNSEHRRFWRAKMSSSYLTKSCRLLFGIALPGPRAPLYLFSKKDAAAPANSAPRLTKFALSPPASLLTPLTSAQQEPACNLRRAAS